ncbi:hypothetical protein [Blastopirellula retiformator]|uniref:Uncharacterized protein n=1 Tax=Blastopirellula retiformator TaxID=2527970 RepID=A0A5C5VKF2_9BACT|nr:hypothetical protein [Blastopirellula retiformator]TWT38437.1 hypothetical protein Enr8_01290 [Blastopirellula retiformator]
MHMIIICLLLAATWSPNDSVETISLIPGWAQKSQIERNVDSFLWRHFPHATPAVPTPLKPPLDWRTITPGGPIIQEEEEVSMGLDIPTSKKVVIRGKRVGTVAPTIIITEEEEETLTLDDLGE